MILKFVIFLGVVYVAILIADKLRGGSIGKETNAVVVQKPKYQYRRKGYFMSHSEQKMFLLLQEAVGDKYFIFPQVHLSTILEHKTPHQNWAAAFKHINGKSVDFVLCDKSPVAPRIAIELDDNSHTRPDRVERDVEVERIFKYAELPLVRFSHLEDLTAAKVKEAIEKAK